MQDKRHEQCERDSKAIGIEVGFHRGSAIRALLSVIIIDVITEEIEEGRPWAMLFTDDLLAQKSTEEDISTTG